MRDEPVLVADRPWEASVAAYNTIIEDGGRYRMWYDFIPPEGDPSGITRGVAYAESGDGDSLGEARDRPGRDRRLEGE